MSGPTRVDLTVVSGSNKTFEFRLTDARGRAVEGGIGNNTVRMFISYGYGKSAHIEKISGPGDHVDDDECIVRFTVTAANVPNNPRSEVWWYEIWRDDEDGSPKPHFVGELTVIGTSRP